MNGPLRRTTGLPCGALFGVFLALVLAGCASTPRAPVEHAFAAPAGQGNPMAQFILGMQMLKRAHTRRRRSAAVAWIRRAAEGNLAMAQDRLGWMYLTGHDVPQDTPRALRWLHRAAARDAPAAQLQLAGIYAAGAFLPVDKAEAYFWYSVAAKPIRSSVTIFNIEQVRFFARMRARSLAFSLTPAQRAAVLQRVAAWQPIPSYPYSASVMLRPFWR